MSERASVEGLKDAACLAHAVPGVSLRLTCGPRRLLVSHMCIGAHLDPCRLRAHLATGSAGETPFVRSIEAVEPVAGIVHLGGGLYARSGPHGPTAVDERWFITTLGTDRLAELLGGCRVRPPDDAFHVVMTPDAALRRAAVCVRCDDVAHSAMLDEVAVWALTTCLVEELLADVATEHQR